MTIISTTTESTLELVAWLREQQSLAGIEYTPKAKDTLPGKEKTDRQIQSADKRQKLKDWQKRLSERFEADEQLKNDPRAQLMMDLLGFHNRERKPKIWAYFERLEKPSEALFDDDTCLHNIEIQNSGTDRWRLKNHRPFRQKTTGSQG